MKNALVLAATQLQKSLGGRGRALLAQCQIRVLPGAYDKVERILDAIGGIDYQMTDEYSLKRLEPSQVLIFNCTAEAISDADSIRDFVQDGGWLLSTDWGLSRCIASAFPNILSVGTSTKEDVVRIQPEPHPITEGISAGSDFWIDKGSETIVIQDRSVVPLVRSKELGKKYRSDLVMIGFQYGLGKVFHSISHFELQRSKSENDHARNQFSAMVLLTNILSQKAAKEMR